MARSSSYLPFFLLVFVFLFEANGFISKIPRKVVGETLMQQSPTGDDGDTPLGSQEVVELVKENRFEQVAPFLSQGTELAEDVLNPDLSDPKQSRVILYIILSLVPVLFLIPLMIGSRDLIPLDALPPVEMNQ